MSIDFNSIIGLMSMRGLQTQQTLLAQANKRLATGLRINSASDDPAGLIAAASLHSSLAELDAESQTNERALVVTSIADGAMGQISDLLDQAKGLVAANASTGGLSDEERSANQVEIDAIMSSVDRLAQNTTFAGKPLLDGTATVSASGNSLSLPNVASDQLGKVTVDGVDYSLADIESGGSLDTTSTSTDSSTSSQVISAAIEDVATMRGTAGAFMQDQIQPRLDQLSAARELLVSSVSMIEDSDVAMDVSAQTRAQLLAAATTNALSYQLMKSLQSTSLMKAAHLDVRA